MTISTRSDGPIANPVAYLHRAADRLMIDRYRSLSQAEKREQAWEADRHDENVVMPTPEREVGARQEAARVVAALDALGERKAGASAGFASTASSNAPVAVEFGVSLSTVEADLREAARALTTLKDAIR